ncbi:MAG: RecX family transcriptional regulator [Clostridia bacterium]|nr:RecX family transcriptional regulator [Clostridia bacterium]MBR6428732.1 RecX family transcriptional regulator [Clostridia bacterium]
MSAKKKRGAEGGICAYDAALSYLTPKARTVREVELKLDEGNYSEGEIMLVIERLIGAGLLDDERYARDFVESRLATKPVSRFRLEEQLRGHFVPQSAIDAALEAVAADTESGNALAVAKKYLRQFENVEDEREKLRRVYTRLQTRGYAHDTIMQALREAASDEER